jgi:hypothetical protein
MYASQMIDVTILNLIEIIIDVIFVKILKLKLYIAVTGLSEPFEYVDSIERLC